MAFLISVPAFPIKASLMHGVNVTITFSQWYFKKCRAPFIFGDIALPPMAITAGRVLTFEKLGEEFD